MMNEFEGNKELPKINFEIKKATVDDVADIQALNKKLFEHEVSEGYDDNLDPDWSFSEEGKKEIQDRITSKENSCGFVSRIDDKVGGYLIGRILEDETGRAESRYADLEHMFVDEKYRGQSIGEELVQEFKDWVKEKGLKRIKTNVSYKNEGAIEFYKKVGLILTDATMTADIE